MRWVFWVGFLGVLMNTLSIEFDFFSKLLHYTLTLFTWLGRLFCSITNSWFTSIREVAAHNLILTELKGQVRLSVTCVNEVLFII